MICTVPMNLAYPIRYINIAPIREQKDLSVRNVLAVALLQSSLSYATYSVVASFLRSSRVALVVAHRRGDGSGNWFDWATPNLIARFY
jgi:hypothetical protein